MKKYKLINLGCANCAGKMEREIQKIEGVYSAEINFMTSKLFIDYDANREEAILREAKAIVERIEPCCQLEYK